MTDPRHPLVILREDLARYDDRYPVGKMCKVPEFITGTSFFPGGAGLWGASKEKPLPPFPVGGVMVLGHDFYSKKGYKVSLKANGEQLTKFTWGSISREWQRAGLSRSSCFFTNAYMGLREEDRNMGRNPGAGVPEYVAWCQAFLARQIEVMQPRLILTLGQWVPSVIAPLSKELASWKGVEKFVDLDAGEGPLRHARFANVDHPVVVAALVHPSMRHANMKRRKFRGLEGKAAEEALLDAAILESGGGAFRSP